MSVVCCSTANATNYQVNTTSLTVISTSSAESEALGVVSSVGIVNGSPHGTCGNNLYIRYEDKEMYALALGATLKGKTVTLIYTDSASYKTIAGYGAWIPCKIIALWVN